MYNNIGLPTPRGSGTSGYVQKNLSYVGSKQFNNLSYEPNPEKAKSDALYKKIDKGILEHRKKREIEVKCLELRDMLEEQGCEPQDIELKVNEFRQALLQRMEEESNTIDDNIEFEGNINTTNVIKNTKMKKALGIEEDYVEGSAFRFDEKKEEAEKKRSENQRKEEERNKEIEKLKKALKDKERREKLEEEHHQKKDTKEHKKPDHRIRKHRDHHSRDRDDDRRRNRDRSHSRDRSSRKRRSSRLGSQHKYKVVR